MWLFVMLVLTSRDMWGWAAKSLWVPHQATIVMLLLLVEFGLGFGAGVAWHKRR